MAILKAREVRNLSDKERVSKLKDLRMELVRAQVTANKGSARTKEIKRAISRLLTMKSAEKINKSDKEALTKK